MVSLSTRATRTLSVTTSGFQPDWYVDPLVYSLVLLTSSFSFRSNCSTGVRNLLGIDGMDRLLSRLAIASSWRPGRSTLPAVEPKPTPSMLGDRFT